MIFKRSLTVNPVQTIVQTAHESAHVPGLTVLYYIESSTFASVPKARRIKSDS